MSQAISHSRAEAYLSCRRKDWYGYQFPTEVGRGIRRLQTSDSLGVGTAFHRIAAVFYNSIMEGVNQDSARGDAWAAYDIVMEEGFEERLGSYASLEEIVHRWLDNETISQEYEILGVEMEFNLVTDEGDFPFVVDLLIRGADGLIYVVDHKTGYYLYTEEQTELMPQIPKYIGALRALGYKVAGGKYQVVRTQKLGGEKMLKAELVEVVGKVLEISDDEAAMKILAKNKVEDLQAMCETHGIEHTKPVPVDKVFQVLDLDVSLDRVMQTMNEQFQVAQELRERDEWPVAEQERKAWRTANQTVCKSCNFRLICNEELRGGNSNLVLSSEYEPKPKRAPIEESEDVDDEA